MSAPRKVLILTQEKDIANQLSVDEAILKWKKDGATLKWSNFDNFQEGKRHGTFDMVFMITGNQTEDDLGMSEEFWNYYASAPIVHAFSEGQSADGEVAKLLKTWNENIVIDSSESFTASNLVTAYGVASTQYDKLMNDDVKPAFAEFDKDGSGAIDKAELKQLSKKLGNELSDGDLETALKDLDLNGDGVIDVDEFARWYFSGMKNYGSNKRSMLKFHGHATNILSKTKEQAKLALIGQELKVKNHKFAVSFNDPKDKAGTTIDFNAFIGGPSHKATLDELSGWLNGSSTKEAVDMMNKQVAKDSDDQLLTQFIQIKISTSNAEEKIAKMNELKERMLAVMKAEGEEKAAMFNPQFKADGDNILIGMEILVPAMEIIGSKINNIIKSEEGMSDMFEMFKEVEQKICFQIALGTSIESIMSSEEAETPLLKHVAKGFKVSSQIALVSNLKKAISEMLKSDSEEEQQMGQMMMMAAPAFIFGINANMDIDFDDFEEIAEHPMAAPAMATFEQLFEGIMEEAPSEYLNKKMDLSSCDTQEKHKNSMNIVNDLIELVCDFEDPKFNNICIKVSSTNVPVSVDIDLKSDGLGSGIKLALKCLLKKIAETAQDIFEKELEEIYHE